VFIGHFAVGYAAKRVAPRVPLPVLFGAAQLADIVWPILVALGIEQVRIGTGETPFLTLMFVSYPYSHSLLMLAIWGVVLALAYRAVTGDHAATPVLIALVLSHWVLDFATHRPDMPLYPGSQKYGLGLWYSVAGTLGIECAMFAIGVWIYSRSTRPRDATGKWSFIGFVVLLLILYAGALGPPPPSLAALCIVSIGGAAVLLVLSWWSDRHRMAVR
jgi:hypothetical protein